MTRWTVPRRPSWALVVFLIACPTAVAQRHAVDLELVLAVDVSASIDAVEYGLQMSGLAAAFRHPEVVSAIEASTIGGIATTVVHWSGARAQAVAVDWTRISDAASAARFADRVGGVPRTIAGGATSISGAIQFALTEIQGNPFEGARLTIDVSGDGRSNSGPLPTTVRDQALALGVTINGLAIVKDQPFVDAYYQENVIGGPNAFVLRAEDYEDFARAIVEKLVREIGLPLSRRREPAGSIVAAFDRFLGRLESRDWGRYGSRWNTWMAVKRSGIRLFVAPPILVTRPE
ncbi:MAG: DUF1194 domain-containing protein [Alphaproteobacteria bacterium]|nr:DUF1194 domain-containing protein [Alphaproteobacteria bacterium]MDP6518135.1 DUF1194 domain-containing protein [Alphaproteobacteria bacterium]